MDVSNDQRFRREENKMPKSLTYADAGVDIDKANALVENIKKIVARNGGEVVVQTAMGSDVQLTVKKVRRRQ